MAVAPHPDSVLAGAEREVPLTARRASWGDDPPNSLAALESCLRAPVARAAVDLHVVKSLGFVAGRGLLPPTVHDRPPRLRDIVALVVAVPGPTTVELRLVGTAPLTWARTEELANIGQLREKLAYAHDLAAKIGRSQPLEICMGRFRHDAAMKPGERGDAAQAVDDYLQLAEAGVGWTTMSVPSPSRSAFIENVHWFGEEVVAKVNAAN